MEAALMRILAPLALLYVALFAAVSCAGEVKPEPSVESLQKENERLRKLAAQLAEQLEGSAKPVNLGRTSIASVCASSVNGRRGLDDPYYGVRNAFDDDLNRVEGQLWYIHWASDGEPRPWIEVWFEVPVTLQKIVVEEGPAFSVQARFARGGEASWPEGQGELALAAPLSGVSRVRVNFRVTRSQLVREVRILGWLPPGTPYRECQPRIHHILQTVEPQASSSYRMWSQSLMSFSSPRVEETEETYVATFSKGGVDIYRVTISKRTGESSAEALVEVVPIRRSDGNACIGRASANKVADTLPESGHTETGVQGGSRP
jgi:hypothetical protein